MHAALIQGSQVIMVNDELINRLKTHI